MSTIIKLSQISCAPDWKAVDTFGRFYNWYLMTCGFFVPTTIVLLSNLMIMNASRQVNKSTKHLNTFLRID